MTISVGIIGVTGYAGQELLRILLHHPSVSVDYLAARTLTKPTPLAEILPAFSGNNRLHVRPFKLSEALGRCDLYFLAMPHGVAMTLAPRLLKKRGARVIDLSGDFRLASADAFARAYHTRHAAPALLKEAVYGFAEWRREQVAAGRLIANPGCYPTATLLGLAPLANARLLQGTGVIVDAKSGVSGAGRSAKEELQFCETNEDLRAYKVNDHQHMPEIEQELSRLSGKPIRIVFVPHLVPLNRGLYATIYAPLTKKISEAQLRLLFEGQYQDEPLVRILPAGAWPDLKSVAGTNRCDIGLGLDTRTNRAIILSAIDNLGKGAAGQAVHNMNLMFGLPETEGLT